MLTATIATACAQSRTRGPLLVIGGMVACVPAKLSLEWTTAHDSPAADGLRSRPRESRHHHRRRHGHRPRHREAVRRARRELVIGSRNARNLERGSAELRLAGYDSLAVQIDVRKTDQVDEMVHRVLHHYGRIDILVNNAAGNFISRAEDLSPNGWDAVIGIVLNGSFYCSRAVGRHMIERGKGGSIVSVLANYVWTGSAGTVHSAAAKAGVMSMTQTLAVEWARHRIRVNAVAPGPIESAGAPRQLWNTPEAVERITRTRPAGPMGPALGSR